jgi:hypothetical protein
VGDHGDGAAGDIHALDGAFVYVPGNADIAGTPVRYLVDEAGADSLATANLEHVSFEFVGHVLYLPFIY